MNDSTREKKREVVSHKFRNLTKKKTFFILIFGTRYS